MTFVIVAVQCVCERFMSIDQQPTISAKPEGAFGKVNPPAEVHPALVAIDGFD